MSVQGEIDRIAKNVSDAYDASEQMGATLPPVEDRISANLSATISSIQARSTIIHDGIEYFYSIIVDLEGNWIFVAEEV